MKNVNFLKRFLFALLLLCPNTIWAYDLEVDGIYYNLTSATDLTVEVAGRIANESTNDLIIPSVVNYNSKTLKVTGIGYNAFSYDKDITCVTIPNSVTYIRSNAFYECRNLKIVLNSSALQLTRGSEEYGDVGRYAKAVLNNYDGRVGDFLFVQDNGTYGLGLYLGSDEELVLPTKYKEGDYSITKDVFTLFNSVTSVTIPNSVTSIEGGAFWECRSLTSVYIENLEAWCNIDFENERANPLFRAKNLYLNGEKVTNLVIPDGVTQIKDFTFYGFDGLTSVTIPNSVTSIGEQAFAYCSGLTNLTLGNRVKDIGDAAFYKCSGLTTITIPNSVTSIGSYAFQYCNSLTSVYIEDLEAWCNIDFENESANPLSSAKKLYLNGEKVTNLVIPDGVIKIKDITFYGFDGLTSVTIPNSVDSIGSQVFSCNLTKLYIADGDNVIKFDENTFSCQIDTLYLGRDWVFPQETHPFSNRIFNSLTFGEGVTNITEREFAGCEGFTSLTIPNSVTSIGRYAFEECSGLTNLTLGNSVKDIGDYAFNRCSGFTTITIPNSVTNIGSAAFRECSGLTNLTFGNRVKDIGNAAFYKCSGLTTITIPNSVTSIGSSAFDGCSGLTNLTFGNRVKDIGNAAFYKCSGLTTITIPNSVTRIGSSAFEGCSGLTTITIPNSVTIIGSSAFEGCSGLTTIAIPNSVTRIGSDAFKNCSSIKTLYLEDGDKSLVLDSSFRYAYPHRYFDGIPFSGCPIKTLYLGRNIESRDEQNNLITHFMSWFLSEVSSAVIGKNVTLSHKNCMNFWGCDKLIDIVVNSGVTNICNQAFEGCSGLTTITIPNSVTNIGDFAFKGCSGLTTIAIPNSVTNIGSSAFEGCSGLTTIAIPNSVTNIGSSAFEGCSGLTNLTLGNSVENIGNSAFSGCLLDSIYMLGKIPPLVDSSNFSNSQYMKSKLYVPKGSLSAYQEAEIWKNFWNIEEKDVTNIESIENLTTHNLLTFEQVENGIKLKNLTNDRILIYTDEGKLIKNILKYNGETINLDKGIYIIYSKKHSCKILVK